ncbi:MAG TPA: right-handed parallel beta-helix repeat-containing protein [Myxococcota bacterium]|nr:right-handed parallel beta-helix repeat-containing protein [Myxococcota bacterium]
MNPLSRCALLVVLCAGFAAHAFGATVLVANDGLDSDTCGTAKDPCRSIGKAITRANDGDSIVVGPGRYGELNNDGAFGGAGEEPNAAGGMIVVDKGVKIQSLLGATLTVIDARGLVDTAVSITGSGASFGGPKRGFTVTGATGTAISANGAGITVSSNLALTNNATGYVIAGSGATVFGNIALGNEIGFNVSATDSVVRGNIAWVNSLVGFSVSGTGDVFDRNLATGNGNSGFNFSVAGDGGQFLGNAAIANGSNGVALTGDGFTIRDTTAIGNDDNGLGFSDPNAAPSGGNLFGNLGCGLRNASNGAVTTSKIYFGSPTGPGTDDPADRVCDIGASTTNTDKFAIKGVKPKVKTLF